MGCILSFLRTGTFNFRFFGAAKRDRTEEGSGTAEDDVKSEGKSRSLEKADDNKHSSAVEELAAIKIQSGYRGYKTRKSLNTKRKGKGGDLSLTSLKPLQNDKYANETEEEGQERIRLEKAADEAIAAEIKTPLETIREESMDGSSFRVKTPESQKNENKSPNPNETTSKPDLKSSIDITDTLQDISEEQEKFNLQELHENLTDELAGDISLDDDAKVSFDLDVELDLDLNEEESDVDREMMDEHVNNVLNAGFANEVGEEDQTSASQSLGTMDVKGASLEIHESEIETMLESEKAGESGGIQKSENSGNPEELAKSDSEDGQKITKQTSGEAVIEAPQKVVEEEAATKSGSQETFSAGDIKTTISINEALNANDKKMMDEPIIENIKSETRATQDSMDKAEDFEKSMDKVDAVTDEEHAIIQSDIKLPSNADVVCDAIIKIENETNNSFNTQPISVDVEMPSLSKCERPSFANTDSVSSSTTTVTVRPVDFQKYEDSSQDASSLSETPLPKPKPRKPVSASLDESKLQENLSEDKENLVNAPQPVLRRQKSSPKHRGKASSSKYRSGMVMDDEVSMEEMENDMMSQAATKIQSVYKGYKTRKTMRQSGVSGKKKAKLSTEEEITATITPDADIAQNPPHPDPVAGAGSVLSGITAASASSDSIRPMAEKPTLGNSRSRSFPGPRDNEEGAGTTDEPDSTSNSVPNIELHYGPEYENKAAVKIQANVRGYLVRRSLKKPKKRSSLSRKGSESVPTVHFDVGDVDFQVSYDDQVENDDVHPMGELIINPANRGLRDSVSPFSDAGSDVAATKIQSVFRGYKERQKIRQTKKAVVTIQATVRGFLTRRRLMKMRRRSFQRRRSSAKVMSPDVQKIQRVNAAATKIQAVYRGYQVRSRIRKDGKDE